MSFDLWEFTDKHVCRPRFYIGGVIHLYPSEASVKCKDEFGDTVVHGKCMREAYFRCVGEEGKPHTATTQLKFRLGKAAEEILVEEWKRAGIWVGNNLKFYNEKHNVSGEVDCIIREPGTNKLIVCEIKSFYGYNAQKELLGSKGVMGKPKMGHLLQTLIYTYELRNKIAYGKMVYLERGNAKRTQFDIKVIPDTVNGDDAIVYRPSVDDDVIMDFTIEDIYARYDELGEAVKKRQVPDKDFDLYYDDARIEKDFANGKISKSRYDKFQKKGDSERPGDWNCSYCNFKDLCWK